MSGPGKTLRLGVAESGARLRENVMSLKKFSGTGKPLMVGLERPVWEEIK
jgi:hypothetical protein